jgi:hypothetical protein
MIVVVYTFLKLLDDASYFSKRFLNALPPKIGEKQRNVETWFWKFHYRCKKEKGGILRYHNGLLIPSKPVILKKE